jgi:hypothetical protein
MYLSNGGEPSPDGGGYPFSVVSRRMMIINPVNIIIVLIRIYKYVDKKGFKKYI